MFRNQDSTLSQKSMAFSCRIVRMVKYLNENKSKIYSPMYSQVLKSGTSISANIGESLFAQTPADFITKLHIALKEANETRNWLYMLMEADCITQNQNDSMVKDLNEIISMLVASIKTAKRNLQVLVK